MFRKTTTVELPEFVRDSIPNVPVEKKNFGSSITDNIYNYTGLEGWPRELYWKPSERIECGIVFLVSNGKEIVIGTAQSPSSPLCDSGEMYEIRSHKKEKRCEKILTPYLQKYCKLLSALFEEEKIDQEIMIYEFVIEIVGSLDKADFSVLQVNGNTVRKIILDTLKRLFQKKHNELFN